MDRDREIEVTLAESPESVASADPRHLDGLINAALAIERALKSRD